MTKIQLLVAAFLDMEGTQNTQDPIRLHSISSCFEGWKSEIWQGIEYGIVYDSNINQTKTEPRKLFPEPMNQFLINVFLVAGKQGTEINLQSAIAKR